MGFGVLAILIALMEDINPVPIDQWFTIGMLDDDEWLRPLGGSWRQRRASSRQVVWAKGLADA